jgi:hypothetical protein
MAYVKFYRGTEANLPTTGLQEGSFYLTTDTWRLYNVINDGTQGSPDLKLHPLGEKINIVQDTVNIGSAADHIGEFAYVESGNIFAVSIPGTSGAKWVQINQQGDNTQLQTLTFAAAAANDTATVTLTGHNANNTNPQGTFSVAAGTGIDVTASGSTVTIAKEATPLTLGGTSAAPTLTVDGGTVSLIAGDNITLSSSNANNTQSITINGEPAGVSSVAIGEAANGFTVTVTGNDNVAKSDSTDPVVQLGSNTGTSYHFQNGVMNLPVYTKDEIDNSLTGLNAMVYKGTIGATHGTTTSVPTTTAPTSGNPDTRPQVGDTYKVVDTISVTTDDGAVNAEPGDLIIARGTEGTSGRIESGLVWDIVRGADDVDSTYAFVPINNGTKLRENNTADKGSLVIAGDGTYITASDNQSGSNNTVTLSHVEITQDAAIAETAVSQSNGADAAYTAVSDVVVDAAGHVTGLKTKTFNVVDTRIKDNGVDATTTVGASNGTITVTQGVQITENNNRQVSDSSAFTLTSAGSTIDMTVSGTNINADLVWGTF